jgi:hypothetical protein
MCWTFVHKRLNSVKLMVSMLCFQLYPQGVWFLFFKGRLEFMKGNIDEAISWYIKSWKSQNVWPQYHHLCFWELMWTNRYGNYCDEFQLIEVRHPELFLKL